MTQTANNSLRLHYPRWLRIVFWLSIVVSVAVVLRRVVVLSTPQKPGAPPELAALDAFFSTHAALTYTHILCALALVSLLPLLFWRRTRDSRLLVRAFFALGFVVAATAYAMSLHVVGGWIERSAVLVFNTLFVAALVRALLDSDREQRQRWMLRSIAILLGIATTRPVMGLFFATSRLTHLTPRQFFGVAFWIGFSTNTLCFELWLRRHKEADATTPCPSLQSAV